jgi:dolichyl-phosphate-mannose--protein O-mannosyl transferase
VVFFALAFSTKWLVLYGAVGMLAILAALRIREIAKVKESFARKYSDFFDHPFLLLIGFIGVAILIYFAIYIPDMLTGRPFIGTYGNGVIDLQFAMYNYHSTLVATHAFSSAWWAWPILVSPKGYVPLWLNISYLPNSIDSTISVMGNPAVWWVGFASMLVVIERAFRGQELVQSLRSRVSKKPKTAETQVQDLTPDNSIIQTNYDAIASNQLTDASSSVQPGAMQAPQPSAQPTQKMGRKWDIAAIFIAVVFLFSWIPYLLISRVTFIYHYYVSVPLICLASAYMINQYWHTKAGKIIAIVFFSAVAALFIAFYPVISGMPAPISYIQNLKWFPSWFFAP